MGTFFCLLLFNLLVGFLISGIASVGEGAWPLVLLVYMANMIVGVWVSLAMQVKRWHDLDRSGWMVLLNFTLIAIPIVWIILGCIRGTEGPNKYGSDPLSAVSFNMEPAYAPPSKMTCDNCGNSYPSCFYLEKSPDDDQYLREKCRGQNTQLTASA